MAIRFLDDKPRVRFTDVAPSKVRFLDEPASAREIESTTLLPKPVVPTARTIGSLEGLGVRFNFNCCSKVSGVFVPL